MTVPRRTLLGGGLVDIMVALKIRTVSSPKRRGPRMETSVEAGFGQGISSGGMTWPERATRLLLASKRVTPAVLVAKGLVSCNTWSVAAANWRKVRVPL